MKTVVVFFAAFIFILATLQTNAQEVTVQQRKREKLPRHLLNEATHGPQVNNAGAGDTKGSAAKDASEGKDPKTTCETDDDRNPAYHGSCQGPNSPNGGNHHYWSTKQEDTLSALTVNSAGVGDTKGPAAKDSSESKDTKTPCEADDDRNPAYQGSCQGSNSPSGGNHHYWSTKNEDTRSASKVSGAGVGDTKGPAATNVPVRKDTNTDVQKDDNNEDRNPSFQNRGLASRFPDDNHHYNVGG